MGYIIRFFILAGSLVTLPACTSIFFQPMKEHVISPEQFGVEYRDVYFKSVDGLKLHGWWFPSQQDSKATVLFLHGNAQNISTHSSGVYWLTKHNYDVFIFDYRGFGRSEGVPILEGALSDIEQAIAYVKTKNVDDKKLFIVGQSLGASMGIFTIADIKEGISGAIFISPFSDYRAITRDVLSRSWITWAFQWPLSFTINNDYRPLDYVGQISPAPTLFAYSNKDEVMPSYHIKNLYEKAIPPKYIEEFTGSHSSILGVQKNRDIIVRYLDEWSK